MKRFAAPFTTAFRIGVLMLVLVFGVPGVVNAAPIADPTGRGWSCENPNGDDVVCWPPGSTQQTATTLWERSQCRTASGTVSCRLRVLENITTNANGERESESRSMGTYDLRYTDGRAAPSYTWSAEGRPSGEGTNLVVAQTDGSLRVGITESAVEGGQAIANVAAGPLNAVLATVLGPFVLMMWAIFKIAAFFLGLAGILFNWAVALLIFQFANFLGNTPGMLVAWGILRDFGNIALIFGFVFMGISAILDLHSYPWKKSLPALVIAAVLINFSLFAAEAVIDTSNVLAATLYNSALAEQTRCNAFSDLLGCLINNGIAGQILDQINIQSVYGETNASMLDRVVSFADGVAAYYSDPIPYLLKYVGLTLVVLVTAFVLFAGAFMLISRAIILAFLMVTSPIGFAGMAVPRLNGLAEDWWKKLLYQAFFAPIFILLLLVALKITEGLSGLAANQGGIGAALAAGDSVNTGPLIMFCLIIGFFLGALMIANRFGIYFSDLATSTAGRMVFGGMGMAGRRFLGRPAYNLYEGSKDKAWARTGMGRLVRENLLKPAAKGNFDISSSAAFKAVAGHTKLDVGKGQHGGYEHIAHEGAKRAVEYGKSLKNTKEEKEEEARRKLALELGKAGTQEEMKANKEQKRIADEKAQDRAETRREEAATLQREIAEKKQDERDLNRRSASLDAQIKDLTARIEVELSRGNTDTATTMYRQQGELEKEKAEIDRNRGASAGDIAFMEQSVEMLNKANKDATREARERSQIFEKQQEAYSTAMQGFDQSIKDNEKAFKNLATKEFAHELEHAVEKPSILWATAAGPGKHEAYKHAAHELEEWAGKGDTERANDRLIEALKDMGSQAHRDAAAHAKQTQSHHDETVHGDHQPDHAHEHH